MSSFKQPNMEMRDGGLTQVEEVDSLDFTNKLYETDRSLFLGDKGNITRVNGDIEIDPRKYKRDALILQNYEFTGIVNFLGGLEHHLDLGEKIVFINCVFEKPLQFNSCESRDTKEFDFSQRSAAIEIVNGSYKILRIGNCTLPFGVDIYSEEGEGLEIDWFESRNNQLAKAGYTFEGVTFKSMLEITGDKIQNLGISFRNCLSTSPLRIESVDSPSISFLGTNTIFENDIRIWGGTLGSLTWNHGSFNDEVDITAVKITQSFTIRGSIFNDRFLFRRKDTGLQIVNFILPKEIWIQDSKFQNGFEFHGDEFKSDNLQVNFSEKSAGVIDIRDTYFKEVTLKGNNFNNSLFLRDCSYDKLILSHFFNKSLISFNNNNPAISDGEPKEVLFQNSNLGNTEFYDFDFSIYPRTRIIDSRLDSIFANGVEWFEMQQLQVEESEFEPKKILSQKREIYRQLKLAAEKQSDRFAFLQFKAREVQIHKKLLAKNKRFSKEWFKKLGDSASIFAGETNDHGQNWIKAILLILGITTLTFPILFSLADNEISFIPDLSAKGWDFFLAKLSYHGAVWVQLFNPARRVSDLFAEPLANPFGVYFLDGLQRIILAFFIFQIVSAFRKFIK